MDLNKITRMQISRYKNIILEAFGINKFDEKIKTKSY